jgi:protein-tyrosine sulfotransferase
MERSHPRSSALGEHFTKAGKKPPKSAYDMAAVRNSSLIFIGGYARSGTTLMRALLDVHDDILCGPETKILPEILKFAFEYKLTPKNMRDIMDAGLSEKKLDDALSLYVYSIMNEHVRPAERLCAKDPNILIHMIYLKKLFPNAKFVFMVRDPRAAVYSLLKQYNETMNSENARKYLMTW